MHSTDPLVKSCETTTRLLNIYIYFIELKFWGGATSNLIILKQTTPFIEKATMLESRPNIVETKNDMRRYLEMKN